MALAAALHHSAGPREKEVSCSRTPLYGDRTPGPEPGRRWSTSSTTPFGDRNRHLKWSGQASLRSLGRSAPTAPCGAPREKLLSSWCRQWPVATALPAPPSLPRAGGSQEEGGGEGESEGGEEDAPSFFWLGLLASSSPMKRKRLRWFRTSASPRAMGLLACTNP